MNSKQPDNDRKSWHPWQFLDGLTPGAGETFGQLVQALVAAVYGIAILILFSWIIVAIIIVAYLGDRSQTSQLLHDALTLVGSALSAVIGYFLGRGVRNINY